MGEQLGYLCEQVSRCDETVTLSHISSKRRLLVNYFLVRCLQPLCND